jgi:RNA polymerase sigma-70 factor, ECF subfamily
MEHTEELIARLHEPQSKHGAFNDLVNAYQKRLYWHIRKIVLNHDDADDILQNVFIKVWNNIDSFRGDSGLYTWLFRIATNESITFLNRQKRSRMSNMNDNSEYLQQNLRSDDYFEGDEIQKKLQEAIALLPDKQRLVFNMKYFDEIKYNDMSEILETSVGALKASYHHAVKKIEEYLKNED